MIKAIIIDDEKQAIASLQSDLSLFSEEVEVVGTANSVETGIQLLQRIQPDILFLDIRLNDGLGFDILEKINYKFGSFEIVFTTAYNQFALKAFEVGAFNYLLKPIDGEELEKIIARYKIAHQDAQPFTDAQLDLISDFSSKLSSDQKIAINTSEGIYLKKVKEIIHVKADGNYSKFFFDGIKKGTLVSRTLKEYEKQLEPYGFTRIHSGHLINLNHLISFHSKDGNYVIMSNQDVLPVSVRKKQHLLKVIQGLL